MNGIPQLPTPSQFLFSLPSIREKVSMQSLKLLMYQHQYEQASTVPKASELKSRWSQLRLLLGSHPARGTCLTLRRHLVTQLHLQPIKALTPTKQNKTATSTTSGKTPSPNGDATGRASRVSPASMRHGTKRGWARGYNAQRHKRTQI